MSNKSEHCPPTCPLASNGFSYIPASGPEWADIALCSDTADNEPAELKMNSLLRRVGLDRENLRSFGAINCRPNYEHKLAGQNFEKQALWECQKHVQPLLRKQHKVYVAAGYVASKQLLNFEASFRHKFKIQDWHGCPTKIGGRWIVPTYSPQFLMAGKQKLSGVVCFDLLQAKQIANGTWKEQPATLRVDPPLEWFTKWVDDLLAFAETNEVWIAIDTETVEKLSGKSEDELDSLETQIVRINFSCNPDEGLTVPFIGGYIEQSRRICQSKRLVKALHNLRYDGPLLKEANCALEYPKHDTMHLWKYLQSDLPASLGFIAPFYSKYLYNDEESGRVSGAWKHLAGSKPGDYAAIDSFQTLRIALGMRKDLIKANQWEVYLRHVYDLDCLVLHPAEDVGLYVDRAKLLAFKSELEIKEAALAAKIASQVDENNQPLIGKWKKPPKDKPGVEILEREVELDILHCTDCGEKDVSLKHICASIKAAKKAAKALICNKKRLDATKCQNPKPCAEHTKVKKPRAAKKSKANAVSTDTAIGLPAGDLPTPESK